MRFLIVEPSFDAVRQFDCADIDTATQDAGLKVNAVDHAMVTPHLAIIVDEFGLTNPAPHQSYFSINRHLYAGNCVIYGVGDGGETVDTMPAHAFATACKFYHGHAAVEAAIEKGDVIRPTMAVNGIEFWRWPDPSPFHNRGERT